MVVRPCDVETIEDFTRYYHRSWMPVKHPITGKWAPMYVQGTVREDVALMPLDTSPKLPVVLDTIYLPWTVFKASASFGPPELGMRTLGDTLAYFYMSARRQWGRGYRAESVELHEFHRWDMQKIGAERLDLHDYRTIAACFEPTVSDPKEAIEKLTGGACLGVAVSSKVGLLTRGGMKNILVAVRRKLAGELDGGVVRLQEDCAHHKALVEETLKMEVKVA